MTNRNTLKREARKLRHGRVRSVVSGTSTRPRLSVFRSATHIYAQLIDDSKGVTLAAASSKELKAKTKNAHDLGCGWFLYHGFSVYHPSHRYEYTIPWCKLAGR
jgi:ribosomal protein L18